MSENKNHNHREHEQKPHEHKEHEHKGHDENKKHEEHAKKEEKKQHDPLKEAKEQLAEMTDKYMRALAELDNFRKRVSKDKEDFVKYTRGDTARTVLPVLDNLDRAVHATKVTDNVESLRKGVELVIKQFEEALKELGVKEIEAKGIFNPEFHQVMSKEASDRPEGEILEVYQKGYMVDDKIIRPALVKVAYKEEVKAADSKEQPSQETDGEKKGENI
ncbi:MAG TPA: nucleotide exchange factor GrpE [Candidatus Goldiibacteriota bacterium]|nr:nucleotide exchange factor GrpE [Candidatus Goldiibacteriota bacterium]